MVMIKTKSEGHMKVSSLPFLTCEEKVGRRLKLLEKGHTAAASFDTLSTQYKSNRLAFSCVIEDP